MTRVTACRRFGLAGVTLLAAILALVCSGCGVLQNGAYDLPLPGGPDAGKNPRTITVHFASVDGLVPKSMVKLGNVAVGEVEHIDVDPDDWTATVTARVRNDVDLPSNATAQVRRSSLLGEWFVELTPPPTAAGGQLPDGGTIPIARTTETAPVEQVLGALSLLLSDGGVPQLDTIVKELNNAFRGRSPQLRALLTDLNRFTGDLDAHKDDIVTALRSMGRLSRTLADNKEKIASALDELPAGVKVLAQQRRQLVTMLSSLDHLSDVAVDVVDRSRADTVADLRALQPTLDKLADAGTDLPGALKILLTFPFTPGVMDSIQGDFVNLHANTDLDLGTLLETVLRGAPDLPIMLPDPASILLGGAASGTSGTGKKHAAGDAGGSTPSAESSADPSPGGAGDGDPGAGSTSGLGGLLGLLLGGGR